MVKNLFTLIRERRGTVSCVVCHGDLFHGRGPGGGLHPLKKTYQLKHTSIVETASVAATFQVPLGLSKNSVRRRY